jgi:hypothetical protein
MQPMPLRCVPVMIGAKSVARQSNKFIDQQDRGRTVKHHPLGEVPTQGHDVLTPPPIVTNE